MNNIFENAYFGKAYKTRDEKKAIFHRNANNRTWYLIREDIHDRIPYNSDGTCRGDNCHDIISEWDEEINEESIKLDARANMPFYCYSESNKDCADAFVEGALYGYHKAKNE